MCYSSNVLCIVGGFINNLFKWFRSNDLMKYVVLYLDGFMIKML